MNLLMVICDRRTTKKIIRLLNEKDLKYHISFYGKGTADNEMLAYLGLAESEKEIVVSFVKKEKTLKVMEQLEKHPLIMNHGAVAFAVPLDAIGQNTLKFIEK